MSFSLKERNIYRYTDGTKEVAVDPLAIRRKINLDPDFDVETDIKLLNQTSNPKACLEAFGRLVTAGRRAFGIEEFKEVDGVATGLLDTEVCELMADFAFWTEAVKKNTPQKQEQPNSTEQAS